MPKHPEKRRHKRKSASFIVIYQVHHPLKVLMVVGQMEVDAIMLNLSEAGMALSVNYNIPVLTTLLLKFTLININSMGDDRIKPMNIVGKVVNNASLGNDEYRIGISFVEVSKEDRKTIAKFAKGLKKGLIKNG